VHAALAVEPCWPQILNAASDLTAIELSQRVSDSHNHPEGVALAPFFQTNKVMAAILRAKVSRAKCGFIPLATQAS
jgi:hypothetical protein